MAVITRREFVGAGLTLGAAAALPGLAGCAAPTAQTNSHVATPSARYGEANGAPKRVLVGYATRTGSTVGVAEAIGETLGKRGFACDVKPLKDGPALEGYDAVILGSAINGGAWLPEAVTYAEANAEALGARPVAVFCVHAMNTGEGEKKRAKREAYIQRIRELLAPDAEAYFAGVGPSQADSGFAKWAFRLFGGDVEGDGRDWDKIRGWAREVAV